MVREHQFNTGATRPLITGMAIIIIFRSAGKVKVRFLALLNYISILCANLINATDCPHAWRRLSVKCAPMMHTKLQSITY
jgi:hypothetical protein